MRRLAGGFCLLLTLAACGISPEPDYYVLASVPGLVAPAVSGTIKIERPVIPGYLDRPDIVRQDGSYRLDIDETRRWASPLDTMLEHVLAEDLRQRMPGSSIITELDDVSATPRLTVETSIETFNRTDDGPVLTAQISIQDKNGCGATDLQTLQFHAVSTAAGAAGMSELAGKLADRISAAIQAIGATPACRSPAPGDTTQNGRRKSG